MKRKVRFSKDYLKKYDIFPTTYVMFVGPPGVARKSTSAGYAEELIMAMNEKVGSINDLAYVNLGPTSGSHTKMIEKMSGTVEGSMTVIAGEFGNIVSISPEDTYDFFTKMFDNAPRYMHSTRGHGDEVVLDPSFNILGCTTPDWIAENTGYMLGGGFAARTIFIFENKARQRRLFYKDRINIESLDKMKDALVKDLIRIGNIKGEAAPENDALAERMEKWYQGYIDQPAEKGTETFQARKHVHTLRTAMLLSASERDDLVIEERHFDQALKLIDEVERKLSRGLSVLGRNPYSGAYYKVLDYVEDKGGKSGVLKGKLMAHFFSDIPPVEMSQVIEVLQAAGEIEFIHDRGDVYLRKRKK